jgi:hypothetical protein
MGSLDNIFANSGDNPNIVNRKLDTTTTKKSGGTLDDIFANAAPVNNNWKQDQLTSTTDDKSLIQKAGDVVLPIVKKIATKVGDWYNAFGKKYDEFSFVADQFGIIPTKASDLIGVPSLTNIFKSNSDLNKYKNAKTEEEKQQVIQNYNTNTPTMKFFNSDTGKKITGAIANNTSNIPLKAIAAIKSVGDDTYDEAYSALLKKSKDPNNTEFEKIMYGVQDSGVQSAIGALLSVGVSLLTRSPAAGRAVGGAYFAGISAESQRQDKGKVYSLGDIAIDTVGDSVIGGIAESALKSTLKEGAEKSVKNFLKSTGKGFLVEGTTEPAQTFLKYANDYGNAKTEEEKKQVVADVTNYVKNGGMIQEFLVGGIAGAGMTGLATGAGYLGGTKAEINTNVIKSRENVAELENLLQKDPNNQNLAQRLANEKENLNDYEQAVKQRPVYISDNKSDNPLATVETVEYPDGKYSYSYNIDTGSNSVQADFLVNELFKSQEEATNAGKKAVSDWVNTQIKDASPEETVKLNEIKTELNNKTIEPDNSIKSQLNDIIKNRKERGNYNGIEGGAKGDSLKFSAWNRAISGDLTETEINNGKKYLESAYVGKPVSVDGKNGEILSIPSFGKSKVQFEDGTTENIEVGKLKTKVKESEVRAYLKEKATKEASTYIKTFGYNKTETNNTKTTEKNVENNKETVKDPLFEEAKKYKSAEAFIKAQGEPLYHGTNKKFKKFDIEKSGIVQHADWGLGIYLTPNKDHAMNFAKVAGGNIVMEVYTPNTKYIDGNELLKDQDFQDVLDDGMGFSTPKEYLNEKGYDGVNFKNPQGFEEYVIYDPNKIYTKEQLKELWTEANKKSGIYENNQKSNKFEKTIHLTTEENKIVKTDNFKKWFGDWQTEPEYSSKIVDERGFPMKMYHNTDAEFDKFDIKEFGKTDAGMYGKGFYFSDTPQKNYGKNTKEVFLDIKKPFYTGDYTDKTKLAEYLNMKENMLTDGDYGFRPLINYNDIYNSNIKEKGYDGIVVASKEGEDGVRNIQEVLAFDSDQIRSVNDEDFSTKEEDINEEDKSTNPVIVNKTQQEVVKNPVKTEGDIKKSRAFDRVKERLGNEYQNLEANYNKLNLEKDTAKALEFIDQNPVEAKKIALGMRSAPEGITETAISIAVAEKALEDGDYGLQAKVEKSRSLRQTRRGQEIVAERGRFNENSPHYFIQQVLAARTEKAVKEGFRFLNKNKSPKSELINEKINQGTENIKRTMKKKFSNVELAQKIIDDLTC